MSKSWYSRINGIELKDGGTKKEYHLVFETDSEETKKKVENFFKDIMDEKENHHFVGVNKTMRKVVGMGTRYMIISRPHHILFECPHCGNVVDIPFQDVDYNTDYWGDGAFCTCPACDKDVELDEFEYE